MSRLAPGQGFADAALTQPRNNQTVTLNLLRKITLTGYKQPVLPSLAVATLKADGTVHFLNVRTAPCWLRIFSDTNSTDRGMMLAPAYASLASAPPDGKRLEGSGVV